MKKNNKKQDLDFDEINEGAENVKPWVLALMLALIVAGILIICLLLWGLLHGKQPKPLEVSERGSYAEEEKETQNEPIASEEQPPVEQPPEKQPEQDQEPVSDTTPETDAQSPTDGDKTMRFDSVQESVTPKDIVNLRSVPSTSDENTISVQISNGTVLSRTGINSATGWSRIDYNGQTLYAVTQYLTTDLNYRPPVPVSDPNRVTTMSGRVIIFENCDDYYTPKEYVNLRTEPSTSEGDATVRVQVQNGETLHRTGYSADYGWSRVEYNGESLYVVTSLLQAS